MARGGSRKGGKRTRRGRRGGTPEEDAAREAAAREAAANAPSMLDPSKVAERLQQGVGALQNMANQGVGAGVTGVGAPAPTPWWRVSSFFSTAPTDPNAPRAKFLGIFGGRRTRRRSRKSRLRKRR